MEKNDFIHINKNIEPIDKITEQDMKKFKNGLLIKRFNKRLEESKKNTFYFLTLQNNFILINNYLLRAGLFSTPISYLNAIDFINTHIFPGNNITVCLYIDQTIIYYDNECQKYIINAEDVKQILTYRPLILDTNLMSLFQIQKSDLQKLKLELINNHFRYTMYQIFGKKYQSSEDMITLMIIALYPNCHIRNPLTYQHLENQTTSESNRINAAITNEDLEYLRTLNVKKTLDDFILECFPQISVNEKINIKNSIENSIPTCVKNIISQLTPSSSDNISNDVIDYIYKIAYFLNNNYLDLFQLFPPSTDELCSDPIKLDLTVVAFIAATVFIMLRHDATDSLPDLASQALP